MAEENKIYKVVFPDGRELYTKDINEREVGKDVLIYIYYIYDEQEEIAMNKELEDAIELISLQARTKDEAIASMEEAVIAVARLSQTLMEAAPSEGVRGYLLSFLPTLHKAYQSMNDKENEKIAKETILWLVSFLPESERGKYAAAL